MRFWLSRMAQWVMAVQVWHPDFDPSCKCGRTELSPQSCPLTSIMFQDTCMPTHVRTALPTINFKKILLVARVAA